tara:strand:- start:9301 stop:10566 length:1266 start_codon:yes stop_codon:yes gene_type:complete
MNRRTFIEKSVKASSISFISLSEFQQSINHRIKDQNLKEHNFDVIVIGVGSMGSSSCFQLAKKGYKVLGIEQFNLPHDKGSHSGQSRIIRKAYFEHPDYVPLLKKAYKNWDILQNESGQNIYHKTGLLYFGKSNSGLLKSVISSSELYDIPLKKLNHTEILSEYKQFSIPDNFKGLLEPDAGFLTPERAILTHVELALKKGASIHLNEKVIDWIQKDGIIKVKTNKDKYYCKKLIITSGAWSKELIPNLKPKIITTQQLISWVIPKKWDDFTLGKFPCWTIEEEESKGLFYGFPILESGQFGAPIGLKIAHHYPGKEINPNKVHREIDKNEEKTLTTFLNKFIPNGYSKTHVMKTCLYSNSPDSDFIVDFLDVNKNVIIGSGFSGHGFKFSSVIGEILSDLAINGNTLLPIDFLRLDRFES